MLYRITTSIGVDDGYYDDNCIILEANVEHRDCGEYHMERDVWELKKVPQKTKQGSRYLI